MKFFKNILRGGKSEELSEEEREKFETIFESDDSDQKEFKPQEPKPQEIKISSNISNSSLEEQIKQISDLSMINKLRNLLDQRERVITGDETLHVPKSTEDEIKIDNKSNFSDLKTDTETVSENTPEPPEIENKFSKEVLDNEIEDYIELSNEKNELPKSEIEVFCDKVRDVFNSKNVYEHYEENSKEPIDSLNGRNVIQLGITNRDFFGKGVEVDKETSWFISSVKDLAELPNFKVLRSDYGRKDLVWEFDPKNTIVLSFRASSQQNSKDNFDFSL